MSAAKRRAARTDPAERADDVGGGNRAKSSPDVHRSEEDRAKCGAADRRWEKAAIRRCGAAARKDAVHGARVRDHNTGRDLLGSVAQELLIVSHPCRQSVGEQ